MTHTKNVTAQSNGKWTYTCSCGKVKKKDLKFESSASAIHVSHLKLMQRYAQTNK